MKITELKPVLDLIFDQKPFQPCDLHVEEEHVIPSADPRDSLKRFTAQFPQATGWLCFQSEVWRTGLGPMPNGIIRYGEMAGDPFTSLLIRPHHRDGWRFLELTEKEGDTHLSEQVTHLGRKSSASFKGPGNIVYKRYWAKDQDLGFLPVTYRFTGFQNNEGGES